MESFTETLINEVRCRRMLWDKKHRHYYNHLLVDREWSKIARITGESKEAGKTKWKNLRDTFRKELKKIPESLDEPSDLAGRYTGTWPHFDAMRFLQSVVTLKHSENSAISLDADFLPLDLVNADIKDSESSVYENDDAQLLTVNYESAAEYAANPSRKRRFNVPEFDMVNLDEIRKSGVVENRIEEDEDLNFFKSLIPHVRYLPSVNKLHFRSQVQSLLIAEINKVQDKSCQENAPHSSSSSSATFMCSQSA